MEHFSSPSSSSKGTSQPSTVTSDQSLPHLPSNGADGLFCSVMATVKDFHLGNDKRGSEFFSQPRFRTHHFVEDIFMIPRFSRITTNEMMGWEGKSLD
jgi:hypothetical protein